MLNKHTYKHDGNETTYNNSKTHTKVAITDAY